jgi:hypothetical protein
MVAHKWQGTGYVSRTRRHSTVAYTHNGWVMKVRPASGIHHANNNPISLSSVKDPQKFTTSTIQDGKGRGRVPHD